MQVMRVSETIRTPRVSDENARVHHVVGVEGALHGAHQRDRLGVLEADEVVLARDADAVLGGDRSTELGGDPLDRLG